MAAEKLPPPSDTTSARSPFRQIPAPATCGGGVHPHHSIVETTRPTYQEFAPPQALREHVLCLWRHGPTNGPTLARVVPDGCIDIIWVGDQPPHVCGPMTAP